MPAMVWKVMTSPSSELATGARRPSGHLTAHALKPYFFMCQ